MHGIGPTCDLRFRNIIECGKFFIYCNIFCVPLDYFAQISICYRSIFVAIRKYNFYYRPQRSCEGSVFTRVCQSFCSQGEGLCYPSMHCRWYPSMPCSRGCAIPACLAAGWGGLLRGGLLQGGCLLWWSGRSARGGLLLGGPASGGCGDPTPPSRKQTATVADGTHPTGMHSCSYLF